MSGARSRSTSAPSSAAHLADGRAEAARAAVGDRAEEAAVAGLEDDVEDHLLGDRVADLDRAAGDRLALAGQLDRAERGAVDAVAAGPAADGDDPVARLDLLRRHPARDHADGPAEDQRVGQVAGIDDQGPVDRGDAHPVAVVADAGDDPLEDALGVEDAGGQAVGRACRAGRRRRRRCCRSAWRPGRCPAGRGSRRRARCWPRRRGRWPRGGCGSRP